MPKVRAALQENIAKGRIITCGILPPSTPKTGDTGDPVPMPSDVDGDGFQVVREAHGFYARPAMARGRPPSRRTSGNGRAPEVIRSPAANGPKSRPTAPMITMLA